ncbi:MAG: hypothetical protein N2691_04005 [Patescibacteria group bacterium]|nr:hypothetical protein [Patescibacteria group bacterium]
MKKRINLFFRKKQQQPIPVMAYTVRTYGILIACICFVLSIVAGAGYYVQLQRLRNAEADVKDLTRRVNANTEIKGEIVFFINKKEQLKKYLADDAQFAQHFYLMTDTLKEASTDAVLKSFDINRTKDVYFDISFTDFENSQKLLDFIEDRKFLDNFVSLRLNNFNVTSRSRRSDDIFTLSFSGKFKESLNARKTEAD